MPAPMWGTAIPEPILGKSAPPVDLLPGHGYQASNSPAMINSSAAYASMSATGSVDSLTPTRLIETAFNLGTPGTPVSYYLGQKLMPDLLRRSWTLRIFREGEDHFKVLDTSLGLREPYSEFQFGHSLEDFKMAMTGAKVSLPRELHREIAEQVFDLVVRAQLHLRRIMDLSAENVKAELLSPDRFDPTHAIDLAGSEINAPGGDGLAAFQTAEGILQAENLTERQRENLKIDMTPAAWEALQNDDAFLTGGAQFRHGVPTFEEYVTYLGYSLDQVDIGDAVGAENGVKKSLWDPDDTGVIYVRLKDSEQTESTDVVFGGEFFAKNHVTPTEVPAPWFDDDTRTDYWPMKRNEFPVVHKIDRGVVIYNAKL